MFQARNAMNRADIYPLVTNIPNGYVMNSRTYQHLSVNPAGLTFARITDHYFCDVVLIGCGDLLVAVFINHQRFRLAGDHCLIHHDLRHLVHRGKIVHGVKQYLF